MFVAQHTRFVIRHSPQRRTLVSVLCGGARRPFAFRFTSGDSLKARGFDEGELPERSDDDDSAVAGGAECKTLIFVFVRDGRIDPAQAHSEYGKALERRILSYWEGTGR